MDYQLRSQGIVPTVSFRNPYRNVGLAVRRTAMTRRKQKGGQFTLFSPSLVAASKKLIRQRKQRRRKRRQKGGNVFLGAAKMGYKLGKQKDYKRMGLTGAAQSSYRRIPEPWLYQ